MVQDAIVDSERMQQLLDTPAEVTDLPPHSVPQQPDTSHDVQLQGRLRFENVTFGYSHDHAVLREVDFEVSPGQTVAVVGPSGGGKSTLGRLLFRLYDVQGGRVTLDGVDVRYLPQTQLRLALGIVPQV